MAFFHNRTVNLLNLHYTIGQIAQGGGGAFFAIYLLKSGLSVPAVLLSLAAIFATRLAIRLLLLPIAVRVGLRALVIAGAAMMGISFLFLAHVHGGVNASLYRLVLVAAVADTVYWPSYHAYFAALGDEEHRGQQTGMREAIAALVGIVSPLVAGWLLVTYGPVAAFYATGAVQALSAIPLFWTPNVPVARRAPGAFRAALSGAMLFIGDGWVAAGYFVAWQIALFLALGKDVMAYGGALAIAALVGAVSGLFLGRLIDSGKGARAVWYSIGVGALVVLLRASAGHNPVLAVTANALGALVSCLYVPTIMTAVYNTAKRSPCVMRFHIAAEGGWDVGVSTGLSLAALLVWQGVPVAWTILIALIGLAFVFVLLQRYYGRHPSEAIDAALTQGEEAARI
jgi:hypothetical protein